MKLTLQGGLVLCNPEQYAIYKNETAGTLVALTHEENEHVTALIAEFERLENIPEEHTAQFYILTHDPKARTHTLSNAKKVFPLNQIEPIFIWYSRA